MSQLITDTTSTFIDRRVSERREAAKQIAFKIAVINVLMFGAGFAVACLVLGK